MKRTIGTGLRIWSRKGAAWPVQLLIRAGMNVVFGLPRGLMVEPSQGCTGGCRGCKPALNPGALTPELLTEWLDCRPAKPVTIHFSGKHSDPLASPFLKDLALISRNCASMISLSTIGLGFRPTHETLPFDRWLFSLPAASRDSWMALRGHDRLDEVLDAVRRVHRRGSSMVELVLTIWKQSEGDLEAFNTLAAREGIRCTKTVFGRYDPDGYHIGRVENLALTAPGSPYELNGDGCLVLRRTPFGCPLAGSLFLSAEGVLRPCPFTGNEAPYEPNPTRDGWDTAKSWTVLKRQRRFQACRFCI